MRLWKIVAETWESKNYPVVIHVFIGQTRKEAQGYFRAHLTTDRFFKDCTEEGHFADFRCRTLVTFDGWVEQRTRPR
jgi:hypothetical protein